MSCARPNVKRSNPKDIGELDQVLRDRIWTAIVDCPLPLILVSGYRDSGRQWDLRHDRCPGRECSTSCKGYPVTARPGTSKHEKRKAADMGGQGLSWLISNRARYGLGLTVRSEDWHFEAEGIDSRTGRRIGNPTVRILRYGGGQVSQPSKPSQPAPSKPADTFREGDRGNGVKFLQGLLNIITADAKLGDGKPLVEDGHYGRRTTARVVEFQRFHNAMTQVAGGKPSLAEDGIAGPQTLKAVGFWVEAITKPKSDGSMRVGDKGKNVEFLQAMLNIITADAKLGDRKPLATDGIYGARTAARVKEFQRFANAMSILAGGKPALAEDGIAGPQTLNAIGFWVKVILGP